MKKKLCKIGIVIFLFFFTAMISSLFLDDIDIAFQIGSGVAIGYVIILLLVAYFKNIISYKKNGILLETAGFAAILVSLLSIASNKNLGSSLIMTSGAYTAAEEYKKSKGKLGIFVYSLFYIGLLSIIGFLFYIFVFAPQSNLDSIGNALLMISFISIMAAVLIIMIVGLIITYKNTRLKMKNEEESYQKLKNDNTLTFDLKTFKKHFARPYYLIAYGCLISIGLFLLELLYANIFSTQVNSIFGKIIVFIPVIGISIGFFYLPWLFPVIIHTMKISYKRQLITLDPFVINQKPKDGPDGFGNYEKIEKTYFIDKINSFVIKNRYIILYGDIDYHKKSIFNNSDNSKSKRITRVKIPRTFSNEKVLIEYLNKNKQPNKK
jgi:hypothetical protein